MFEKDGIVRNVILHRKNDGSSLGDAYGYIFPKLEVGDGVPGETGSWLYFDKNFSENQVDFKKVI